MEPVSILAIFFLVFVGVAFVSLPFGVKTDLEMGNEMVPGQAESAPHQFDLKRLLLRSALIAAPLTALYVANYHFGWIGLDALDFSGGF